MFLDKASATVRRNSIDQILSNLDCLSLNQIGLRSLVSIFEDDLEEDILKSIVQAFRTVSEKELLTSRYLALLEPFLSFKGVDLSFITELVLENFHSLLPLRKGFYLIRKLILVSHDSKTKAHLVKLLKELPPNYFSSKSGSILAQCAINSFPIRETEKQGESTIGQSMTNQPNTNLRETSQIAGTKNFTGEEGSKKSPSHKKSSGSKNSASITSKNLGLLLKNYNPHEYFKKKSALKFKKIYGKTYKHDYEDHSLYTLQKFLLKGLVSSYTDFTSDALSLLRSMISNSSPKFKDYFVSFVVEKKNTRRKGSESVLDWVTSLEEEQSKELFECLGDSCDSSLIETLLLSMKEYRDETGKEISIHREKNNQRNKEPSCQPSNFKHQNQGHGAKSNKNKNAETKRNWPISQSQYEELDKLVNLERRYHLAAGLVKTLKRSLKKSKEEIKKNTGRPSSFKDQISGETFNPETLHGKESHYSVQHQSMNEQTIRSGVQVEKGSYHTSNLNNPYLQSQIQSQNPQFTPYNQYTQPVQYSVYPGFPQLNTPRINTFQTDNIRTSQTLQGMNLYNNTMNNNNLVNPMLTNPSTENPRIGNNTVRNITNPLYPTYSNPPVNTNIINNNVNYNTINNTNVNTQPRITPVEYYGTGSINNNTINSINNNMYDINNTANAYITPSGKEVQGFNMDNIDYRANNISHFNNKINQFNNQPYRNVTDMNNVGNSYMSNSSSQPNYPFSSSNLQGQQTLQRMNYPQDYVSHQPSSVFVPPTYYNNTQTNHPRNTASSSGITCSSQFNYSNQMQPQAFSEQHLQEASNILRQSLQRQREREQKKGESDENLLYKRVQK